MASGVRGFDPVAAFRALGDPTRWRLFRFLSCCDCSVALDEHGEVRPVKGPTVGEVCCSVTGAAGITSTVSHHLRELRLAGLITTKRRGKHIVCAVVPQAVKALSDALQTKRNQEETDANKNTDRS